MDHKLEQVLLNFNSPYIESFLLQYAAPSEVGRELLWKFYAKNERFSSAADVLLELAQSPYISSSRLSHFHPVWDPLVLNTHLV